MKVWPLIQARLALYWEKLAPVLWPAALLIGLYAAVSIFGLWDRLGDPWRAIAYLSVVATSFWLGWKRLQAIEWPDEEDAARRVEDDSGIPARPHEALIDRPVDIAHSPGTELVGHPVM